jgi:hypothetical protein
LLAHQHTRHRLAGHQHRRAGLQLLEPIRLVELDPSERRLDLKARCVVGTRVLFGKPKERRTDSLPSHTAANVHRRAILRIVNAMRRKAQHDPLTFELAKNASPPRMASR